MTVLVVPVTKKKTKILKKFSRNDMTIAFAGTAVGMVLFYLKFGASSLLVYVPLASFILFMQYKFKVITKIVTPITSVFSHVVTFILQLVLVVGKKNSTPSGWVPAKSWGQPTENLWGIKVNNRNYYTENRVKENQENMLLKTKRKKIKLVAETLILVIAVLLADIVLGVLSNKVFPRETLSEQENMVTAQTESNNLRQLQEDALNFTFDFTNTHPVDKSNGDKLWQITDGSSGLINYTQSNGRATYSPEQTDYTIALIGGSSAFGTGQSDSETIASYVSKILENEGKSVKIYNYGIPAYTTYQASKLLEEKLENGEKFDAVLVLSGFNDVILGGLGRRVPETLLDQSLAEYYNPNILLKWADNSLTARLIGYKKRQKKPIMTRVLVPITEASGAAALGIPKHVEENVQYNIIKGVQELNSVQEKYGTPVVYVWVPRKLTASGGGTSLGELSVKLLLEKQKQLIQNRLENSMFVDLDEAGLRQSCFIDEVHTVDPCSAEQAEKIIVPLLEKVL